MICITLLYVINMCTIYNMYMNASILDVRRSVCVL